MPRAAPQTTSLSSPYAAIGSQFLISSRVVVGVERQIVVSHGWQTPESHTRSPGRSSHTKGWSVPINKVGTPDPIAIRRTSADSAASSAVAVIPRQAVPAAPEPITDRRCRRHLVLTLVAAETLSDRGSGWRHQMIISTRSRMLDRVRRPPGHPVPDGAHALGADIL